MRGKRGGGNPGGGGSGRGRGRDTVGGGGGRGRDGTRGRGKEAVDIGRGGGGRGGPPKCVLRELRKGLAATISASFWATWLSNADTNGLLPPSPAVTEHGGGVAIARLSTLPQSLVPANSFRLYDTLSTCSNSTNPYPLCLSVSWNRGTYTLDRGPACKKEIIQ